MIFENLELLYSFEPETHRRFSSEDLDHHGQFFRFFVNFFDRTGEIGEWAVDDLHDLTDREIDFDPGLLVFVGSVPIDSSGNRWNS